MQALNNDEKYLVSVALRNYLEWFDPSLEDDQAHIQAINDALTTGDFTKYMNLDGAIADWITNLQEADAIGYAKEIATLENVLNNKLWKKKVSV